jgi:hypothetical protein
MTSGHLPAARPPLSVNANLVQSSIHKNLSRQNSLTNTVETPVPQPDEALLGPGDEKEKAELKRDEERRGIFQKFSNDVLNVPSGYRKVEVLIIRWDESIDDFKGHNNEVRIRPARIEFPFYDNVTNRESSDRAVADNLSDRLRLPLQNRCVER